MKGEVLTPYSIYGKHGSANTPKGSQHTNRRVRSFIQNLIESFSRHEADRGYFETLKSFDDRMLKDIGITRLDVKYISEHYPLGYAFGYDHDQSTTYPYIQGIKIL